MAWISLGALSCSKKEKTWWQLASSITAPTLVRLLQSAGFSLEHAHKYWRYNRILLLCLSKLFQLPDSEPGPSRIWNSSYETAFGKSRKSKRNESVTINRYCKWLLYSAAKFNLLKPTGYVMQHQFEPFRTQHSRSERPRLSFLE